MGNVYIVVKESKPVQTYEGFDISFRTNEAVFDSEDKAKDYIKARKALKDRDDRGCKFNIEPWRVQ